MQHKQPPIFTGLFSVASSRAPGIGYSVHVADLYTPATKRTLSFIRISRAKLAKLRVKSHLLCIERNIRTVMFASLENNSHPSTNYTRWTSRVVRAMEHQHPPAPKVHDLLNEPLTSHRQPHSVSAPQPQFEILHVRIEIWKRLLS